MKKKSVIAINLCLIASIVTLFGNKIYMLYIGDCHQLWEEAQTHYVNRQYEKARELLEKIARIDTAHHAQYLTGDMYLKGLGGEIDYDKALKLFHQSATGVNSLLPGIHRTAIHVHCNHSRGQFNFLIVHLTVTIQMGISALSEYDRVICFINNRRIQRLFLFRCNRIDRQRIYQSTIYFQGIITGCRIPLSALSTCT